MIITRRHLPRRTFLKGMGAVIALPALDAMTPAFAQGSGLAATARASSAPVRLAFMYVPNGVTMADWTPRTAGAAFEFSRILKPLEPFRADTLVLEIVNSLPFQSRRPSREPVQLQRGTK